MQFFTNSLKFNYLEITRNKGGISLQTKKKTSIVDVISAYIIWGFLPIYWKLIDNVNAGEILAHRIIWSFVFMLAIITGMRAWPSFIKEYRHMLKNKKQFIGITLASIVISTNWLTYIWAVNNEYIVQASLGYYINPLISVLLGVIILKEKLTKGQVVSVLLASIGVLLLTVHAGVFPWVSIWLAISFAIYGFIKKTIHLSAMNGLTIETMIVTPIAFIYLLQLPQTAFSLDIFSKTNIVLIGAGIATATPLLLFSKGAKGIPLSMIGFLQYIAPTIMLGIGVFLYHETFSSMHLLAFSFIWIALIIYIASINEGPTFLHRKRRLKEHS